MAACLRLIGAGRTYQVHERQYGVMAALGSLFKREYKTIHAVTDLTFDVAPGEVVGFLGPNGAGKTTTIKMLSGLLFPTAGQVEVLGYAPWKRDKALLKRITLIMGRRNQLIWDVPAVDSFEFFRAIYDIPRPDYTEMLDYLVKLLDLGPLLKKPVRNLSLGERMRCELTGALLHRPKVLFLDEPTLGLDTLAQFKFREFIAQYNRRYEATVLLTSHYMGDVEDLCRRVIFIDHGRLVFDGAIEALIARFLPYKTIQVRVPGAKNGALAGYGEVVSHDGDRVTIKVPKDDTSRVVSRLMADLPVTDISIADPPVTDVVKYVYENRELVQQ